MSKLSNCKSCKAEIAKSAKVCPGCGAKNKKPFYTKWWVWAIVIVVAIGIASNSDSDNSKLSLGASTSGQTEKPAQKTKLEKALDGAIEVDYKELHKEYMDNAIGADGKYKDKTLILVGEVDTIDREIAGHPYVTFNVDGYFNNIRITFSKDEEEKVAQLSKGQTIKIVGKCKGTLISTTVALGDCLLVD